MFENVIHEYNVFCLNLPFTPPQISPITLTFLHKHHIFFYNPRVYIVMPICVLINIEPQTGYSQVIWACMKKEKKLDVPAAATIRYNESGAEGVTL